MSKRVNHLLLCVLMAVILAACSPAPTDPTKVELSDLTGLWNSSENSQLQKDIMYTRITSDGGIIEYDFDGDRADRGLKCYQIDSGTIHKIVNNRFLVTADMHANSHYEVELELLDNGYALKVYFLDSDDMDGDGNLAETVASQIWTRVPDTSFLDSEPSCKQR